MNHAPTRQTVKPPQILIDTLSTRHFRPIAFLRQCATLQRLAGRFFFPNEGLSAKNDRLRLSKNLRLPLELGHRGGGKVR